jgi:poly(3-hydroxybutyrate) depolymerase
VPRSKLVIALWLASLALGPRPARAEEPLPRGQIVDRIVCRSDPSKSYALYVPSSYTPDRAWPILYCFDPDARGRQPVERYAEAAERFGWIVAGSLESRNGKIDASIAAGAAMWNDTHARFKIDERRIYTTGFSGGARVATWAAMQCGTCIAGVIADGAGFPTGTQPGETHLPQSIAFAYFATIGTDDFNFPELKTLDGLLARAGVPHEVARWSGTHDWAPVALCTRAVGWMEARAMRTGLRPKDDALVAALLSERLDEARAAEGAGRTFDAWLAYAGAANEFSGLADVADTERRAAALATSKEVRDALAREDDEIKQQMKLAGEAAYLANTRADQEDPLFAKQQFRARIADLRKTARAETDSSERRVARRALHQIFAYYYEGGGNLLIGKKYKQAVEMFSVAAEIAPKAYGVHYSLAEALALSGDTKRALASLHLAVENGFADAAQLRADPAFEPLRSNADFQRLVETAGRKP